MARKKKQQEVFEAEAFEKGLVKEHIEDVEIASTCLSYNKIFSANDNILRMSPWLYTGLLTCEFRLLWTLYVDKAYKKKFIKVSKLDGDCSGNFHPHGSTYKTIVGMAQIWNKKLNYITPDGNFGDLSGSEAAAARYIKCSMSEYAYKCFFEDFDITIADMKPTYTGDSEEPNFILPSKYPNILLNPIKKIALGLSPSIYPCNFNEVIDTTIKLMDNPNAKIKLSPDIPTGCDVLANDWEEICNSGKGRYRMRGVIDVDEENNQLIIRSVPLEVKLTDVIQKVVELIKSKELTGIKDFSDNSTKNEMNYRIILRPEADPYKVRQQLFSKTQLTKTNHIDMICVEDYTVRETSVRDVLLSWIDFRKDYVRRLYNRKLVRYHERKHILDILLYITNSKNRDTTMKIAGGSRNKEEMQNQLMEKYGISSMQAKTISAMRIQEFNLDAVEAYKTELEELENKLIPEVTEIVMNEKSNENIIKEELLEGKRLFGSPRRSKIITTKGEQIIRNSAHTLIVTDFGYIKKLKDKVKSIGNLKEGDKPKFLKVNISNAATLLMFSSDGSVFKVPVCNIPDHDSKSYGTKLEEMGMPSDTSIVNMILCPTQEYIDTLKEEPYVIFITRNGLIKKTELSEYINIKSTVKAMTLNDDDELVNIRIASKDKKDILIYTNDGWGTRIHNKNVSVTGRVTKGCRGIVLGKNQYVIGLDIIENKDKGIFVLTTRGNGKISELQNFPVQKDGKTLRITNLSSNETIAMIRTVKQETVLTVFLKSDTKEIRIEDLEVQPRISKGVKLIPVKRGDSIIDIKELEK